MWRLASIIWPFFILVSIRGFGNNEFDSTGRADWQRISIFERVLFRSKKNQEYSLFSEVKINESKVHDKKSYMDFEVK